MTRTSLLVDVGRDPAPGSRIVSRMTMSSLNMSLDLSLCGKEMWIGGKRKWKCVNLPHPGQPRTVPAAACRGAQWSREEMRDEAMRQLCPPH